MSKEQEVIDGYLERMKDPSMSQSAFEQLAARVRTLQALGQEA